jgi:drug/metabolite transporter (DMT)-like permease
MKLGLSEVRPWTFRTVCLAVGSVGLLALAKAAGHSLRIPTAERLPLGVVALFNITTWHMLSAYGVSLVQAGRAAIIAYTMPLWAVILGRVLLGERLTRGRAAALVLGLGGLAVLMGPEIAIVRRRPAGALVMLAAAICWAMGTVLMKRFHWTSPTILLTGWQLVLGGIPVLAGMALFEPNPLMAPLTRAGVIGTAYASVVGVIFCHYAWFRVLRVLPSGVAAIGTLGIPIVGTVSSAMILGEAQGVSVWIALALVVTGLAIVLAGASRSRPVW